MVRIELFHTCLSLQARQTHFNSSSANRVPLVELHSITGPHPGLYYYLHWTVGSSRPHHLFVSLKDCTRPMSKAAISYFIGEIICLAHETFPDHLGCLLNAKSYDIPTVTTSLLWNVKRRLLDVMEASCWRMPSFFCHLLPLASPKDIGGHLFPQSCYSRWRHALRSSHSLLCLNPLLS